jgi:hypothetical protein
MPTFRTRIREVEAFQWTGQPEFEWPQWAQSPRYLSQSGTALYAYTLNGPIRVERSNWIIKGDKEIYPCTDEEFRKRYEPVAESPPFLGEEG